MCVPLISFPLLDANQRLGQIKHDSECAVVVMVIAELPGLGPPACMCACVSLGTCEHSANGSASIIESVLWHLCTCPVPLTFKPIILQWGHGRPTWSQCFDLLKWAETMIFHTAFFFSPGCLIDWFSVATGCPQFFSCRNLSLWKWLGCLWRQRRTNNRQSLVSARL